MWDFSFSISCIYQFIFSLLVFLLSIPGPRLVISLSLYSTSSASSPWSPSISKAAYLLAELNFCKNIRTDRTRMSMESLKEHESDDFTTPTACLSTVKCLKNYRVQLWCWRQPALDLRGLGFLRISLALEVVLSLGLFCYPFYNHNEHWG